MPEIKGKWVTDEIWRLNAVIRSLDELKNYHIVRDDFGLAIQFSQALIRAAFPALDDIDEPPRGQPEESTKEGSTKEESTKEESTKEESTKEESTKEASKDGPF